MTATATPKRRKGGTAQESDTVELHRLVGLLRDIANSGDEYRSLEEAIALTRQLTHSFGVAYLERNESGHLQVASNAVSPADFAQISTHRTHLFRVATLACAERTSQVAKLEAASPMVAYASPVFRKDGQPEAIVGVANAEGDISRVVASTLLVTQLVAAYIASWRGQLLNASSKRQSDRRIAFAESLSAKGLGDTFAKDIGSIAEDIREYLGCRSVALGLRRGESCRLLAISGEQKFDANSAVARQIESVMDESLVAGLEINDNENTLSARNELAKTWNATGVESYPIVSGDVEGSCLVAYERPLRQRDIEHLCTVLPNVGARMGLLQSAHRTSWQRLAAGLFGKKSFLRKPMIVTIVVICGLAMLIPTPSTVNCNCSIQPVKRRFVAVPYEGRLEKTLVKPGDTVQQGQTIAFMDGSEIRYQLAGLTADFDRAEREKQQFLAIHDISAAQIAALQMERLQNEITILRQRENNLEIKSPIDGVVISGEPQKIEGSRAEKGQKLVEVGPIQQMLVELEIPEDAILSVESGQKVRFRLHSDPLQAHEGVLRRIHPRSEQVDSKNVFVGEVLFDNDHEILRPGMSGKASVIGRRMPLGWNLFHNAWNKAIFWLGW